jgi:hypothetical protein
MSDINSKSSSNDEKLYNKIAAIFIAAQNKRMKIPVPATYQHHRHPQQVYTAVVTCVQLPVSGSVFLPRYPQHSSR